LKAISPLDDASGRVAVERRPARKKVSNLRLEEPALRTRIASATPDS
jgi:hypothetical protein